MVKLLVIFGITGQQGGALARTILEDPQLSEAYKIRGITRDTSKPDAKALQEKHVDVVKGDNNDPASIKAAVTGAHAVFMMTTSNYGIPGGREQEFAQGKVIADEAIAAGVQLLIFSTLPSPEKISDGKYPVWSWDVKYDIEQYIRGLSVKSIFFAPGSFMSNLHNATRPVLQKDGSLAIINFLDSDTLWPLIATAKDSGKYLAPALAEPEHYYGKTICAATKLYSFNEMVEILAKVTGKKVNYVQVPQSTWTSYLPEPFQEVLSNMNNYIAKHGYYGPSTATLVSSSAQGARGELTSLEEYLVNNPIVFN